jgi:hypothetical protein
MDLATILGIVIAGACCWHIGRTQGSVQAARQAEERDVEHKARITAFFSNQDYLRKESILGLKNMLYPLSSDHAGPLSLVGTVYLIRLAILSETHQLDERDYTKDEFEHHQKAIESRILNQYLDENPQLSGYGATYIREHVIYVPAPRYDAEEADDDDECICEACDGQGQVCCAMSHCKYGGEPCPTDCSVCHGAQWVTCLDCSGTGDSSPTD